MLTWPKFFYRQQRGFLGSESWQTWIISGNGCGKSLLIYEVIALHVVGAHPRPVGNPPVKVKVLVPSFDYVADVALEKLLERQTVVYRDDPLMIELLDSVGWDHGRAADTKLFDSEELRHTVKRRKWMHFMIEKGAVSHFEPSANGEPGRFEMGPILPKSLMTKNKGFTKDHKGIELKNGSSIWFSTSEQGWQAQRGGEQDILVSDEEGDERVWDEMKRGLRNAKGGGRIYAGLTPPYLEGQGPTWTKRQIVDMENEDPSLKVIRACMMDNPAITPKFIEEFKKGKTSEQINVQVYGQYPAWGDLVHKDFQDRFWDPKRCDGHLLPNDTPMPDNNSVDWVMSFDWHPSKPCAAIWGYIDRQGNLTVFDELDKDWAYGKEITELVQAFKQIEGGNIERRKWRRWQDPSAKHKYHAVKRGFNAWDAFRKEGVITSAGKNRDANVGIDIVNQYFRGNVKDHPRIFIHERCKNLRKYLVNHYWRRGEDGVGKPDPKWSDYPITLRYILEECGWKRGYEEKRRKYPLYSFEKPGPKTRQIDLGRFF
jgi:hypothetical protein